MDYEEMKVVELRDAARHFVPETRGVGGLAHTGNKEQLIELLRNKGVMPSEAQEFVKGNKKIEAPQQPEGGDPFGLEAEGAEGDAKPEGEGAEAEAKKPAEGKDPRYQPESPEAMKGDFESKLELELLRHIITRNLKPSGIDPEAVAKIADEVAQKKLDEFRKETVKVIEVKQPGDLPNKKIGIAHKLTEQIAQVCNLGVHQMLVGPAGGGKTTCCEKVAEILNLTFYPMSVGPQTTKSDLLGFIDAAGNYHTTPLREAFEKGGLLLLDEVDAANAGVLTIINALLANGYCSFPDGIKQRHEGFRCICACNTYGRGADRQYVGRNQLDAATLDRFAVVDFDYDEDLERAIAGNNTWVKKVQKFRKRAFDLKMRVVISPRASIFGSRLLASGMNENLVEELVVWKGVSAEIRSKIQA